MSAMLDSLELSEEERRRAVEWLMGEGDQQWGVTPDDGFELKLDDDEMYRLIESRRQKDILKPKNGQPKEADESDDEKKQPPESEDDPAEDSGDRPDRCPGTLPPRSTLA